ncbi:restriction endonuclease subunit S [Gammaproteobacteria bacterium]|nr:restriction endonuclease subunit S [Gammaproteobacteria bacterium]
MSSVVPEGWQTLSLSEGIDILSGYPFDSSSFTDDSSKTGLIRIRDLVRQKVATYFDGAFDDNYLIRKGDVLIGMDGDFNIVKWDSAPSLLNQRICKVTVAGEIFDLAYLYQDLQKDLLEINNQTGSTTVKHLSVKDIRGIHKSYPPLPEQKKIASILTSVDEVIENTQKQIDKLQDLKKATMNELLTKGIGHTEFKDSELGRIPKSWEVVQLKDNLEFISYGFTNPMPETSTGVPMITAKDVTEGSINYKTARNTSREAFDSLLSAKSRPLIGDILLTKDGSLGRLAIVDREDICINQSVAVLRPNKEVSSSFLFRLLESPLYQKIMMENAGGSTIKHIYITVVDKMKVVRPPCSEQDKIVAVLSSINKRVDRVIEKLSQTQSLKKSLMQDLLTGKVRVTVN